MNTCKTPKGTELPLISLKGKPYLQVAHRFVWLNEETRDFSINTEFLVLEQDLSVCRATVVVRTDGIERKATATKREDSRGFADHSEKAETGAVGRALAMLGFGTQFTLPDLDEGERIVDSPITPARRPVPPKGKSSSQDDF